jgi:hypothetical protein
LAFRVGIVGHRPDRLPRDAATLDALRQTLSLALEAVQAEVTRFAGTDEARRLYSGHAAVLRAVSPLAEGSDRMFAEAAIDLGYELLCPMPFVQAEFENDFLPQKALETDSLARFRGLLERARTRRMQNPLSVFELDGDRAAEAKAYGAAGRVVLNQSDLIIAVWDGGKAAGGGGTVETLRRAVHFHVPVLWIHSVAPEAWQLFSREEELGCLDGDSPCRPSEPLSGDPSDQRARIAAVIGRIVEEELRLPTPSASPAQLATIRRHAEAYSREHRPRVNLAFVWKLFRDLVGDGRFRLRSITVEDFEAEVSTDWPISSDKGAATGAVSQLDDWVNARLRPHYAFADKRGDLYADAYRSAYVSIYLLSAIAVFLALLPTSAGGWSLVPLSSSSCCWWPGVGGGGTSAGWSIACSPNW